MDGIRPAGATDGQLLKLAKPNSTTQFGCRTLARCFEPMTGSLRNSCKHNGAVLPLPSAPEGRGADGVDAMA
jgi:hypothetical protein